MYDYLLSLNQYEITNKVKVKKIEISNKNSSGIYIDSSKTIFIKLDLLC